MKNWIEYGPDGQIYLAGMNAELPEPQHGGTVEAVAQAVDPTISMRVDGEVIRVGPRPTFRHTLDFATRSWVLSTDAEWAEIRSKRDALLAASDRVVLRAYEQGIPVPAAWVAYRQALRDITGQGNPGAVVWPSIPG